MDTVRQGLQPRSGTNFSDFNIATCEPFVQRRINYARAPWSANHLHPDAFGALLAAAPGQAPGAAFAVPYRDIYEVLDAGDKVEIDEHSTLGQNARAQFTLDHLEATGGKILINPPPPNATALELRRFAAAVSHEMQHAVDAVNKRLHPREKGQTEDERKISSELRAFGREAAAALKLAIGETYEKRADRKLTKIIDDNTDMSGEHKRLALEFHKLDSTLASRGREASVALKVFTDTSGPMLIKINDSVILERVAGYLTQYRMVETAPDAKETKKWLVSHPEVTQKGLVEGVKIFHDQRPQPREANG
ncbi:hypothetical protein GCM10010464_64970 [Pseudonocardia yunnanensis]|uniref:Uncharacterized protein n=1 Tax=Pseudonocardia yunnanensis TaxID=58107 RepID=A0ABW4F8Q5_9PSEU